MYELEPKYLDTWSWSLKFEFRLHSPAFNSTFAYSRSRTAQERRTLQISTIYVHVVAKRTPSLGPP